MQEELPPLSSSLPATEVNYSQLPLFEITDGSSWLFAVAPSPLPPLRQPLICLVDLPLHSYRRRCSFLKAALLVP